MALYRVEWYETARYTALVDSDGLDVDENAPDFVMKIRHAAQDDGGMIDEVVSVEFTDYMEVVR